MGRRLEVGGLPLPVDISAHWQQGPPRPSLPPRRIMLSCSCPDSLPPPAWVLPSPTGGTPPYKGALLATAPPGRSAVTRLSLLPSRVCEAPPTGRTANGRDSQARCLFKPGRKLLLARHVRGQPLGRRRDAPLPSWRSERPARAVPVRRDAAVSEGGETRPALGKQLQGRPVRGADAVSQQPRRNYLGAGGTHDSTFLGLGLNTLIRTTPAAALTKAADAKTAHLLPAAPSPAAEAA